MKTRTNEPVRRLSLFSRAALPGLVRAAVGSAILGATLGIFAIPALAGVGANAATATKVPKPRSVEGIVRNKSGAPVQGAVVYLKDTRSLAVKSYLSDDGGQFHFRQLSLEEDYDLWAELHGDRSKIKSISHFKSTPDLHYTLKIDTGK
jgi:hypothetical protein